MGRQRISIDRETEERVAQRIKALGEKYAGEFPAKSKEIAAIWKNVEAGEEGALHELYRLVHGLAGSGETFGFAELSSAARECEQLLLAGIDTGDLDVEAAKVRVASVLAQLIH